MVPYIDMHCDTLSRAYFGKKSNIYKVPEYMVDIARLKEGGCWTQFFAIFMQPESEKTERGDAFPDDLEYIEGLLQIFRNNMQEHSEVIAEARTFSDLEKNASAGKMSGILTVEDGRWVGGSMERLEWLYQEGIRLIGLTWNFENCFGFPNSQDPEIMGKGLKEFGKEAIVRMNELGMLVDVSHLSDGGFWDVVRITKKPFVASHSNCRSLSPHQRNLTDEMIRALAEKGGVMGLNFCPPFLNADAQSGDGRITYMIQHLKHMVNVGGTETAAIGTDLDGIGGDLEIASCAHMQMLFEAMAKSGFTSEQIDKIAYKNAERVLREVLPA